MRSEVQDDSRRGSRNWETDRAADEAGEPSLAEMTGLAIDLLSKDEDGFFLMVEGGRIDHGHHAGNAERALTDTIAFSDAVRVALEKTDARPSTKPWTPPTGPMATCGDPSTPRKKRWSR